MRCERWRWAVKDSRSDGERRADLVGGGMMGLLFMVYGFSFIAWRCVLDIPYLLSQGQQTWTEGLDL